MHRSPALCAWSRSAACPRPSGRSRLASCCPSSVGVIRAQGALSPHASAMHYHDISPMSRHGKSHILGFSVVTESLEKSVPIENSLSRQNTIRSLSHGQPRPVMRVQCPVACPGFPCGSQQKNILSQHHPWNFCHYRNVPPLGKLYHDMRRPLSRPKPNPALNPVVTLNSYCDTGSKNLCRYREGLCRDPNHPACQGTVS